MPFEYDPTEGRQQLTDAEPALAFSFGPPLKLDLPDAGALQATAVGLVTLKPAKRRRP